jgi:hypothetical protein
MRDVPEIALKVIELCEQSISRIKNRFEPNGLKILTLDLIALLFVVIVVLWFGCFVWLFGGRVAELSFETDIFDYVVSFAMSPLGALLCIIPVVVLGVVFLFIALKLLLIILYMGMCTSSLIRCMTYKAYAAL